MVVIEASGRVGGAGNESKSEVSMIGVSPSESEFERSIENETFFFRPPEEDRLEKLDEAEMVRLWIGGGRGVSSTGELTMDERAEFAGEEKMESTEERTDEAMEELEWWLVLEVSKETLSTQDWAFL